MYKQICRIRKQQEASLQRMQYSQSSSGQQQPHQHPATMQQSLSTHAYHAYTQTNAQRQSKPSKSIDSQQKLSQSKKFASQPQLPQPKGKTPLAREYYMMQAIVHNPQSLASSQILQQQIANELRSGESAVQTKKVKSRERQQQFIGTPDQHHSKSGKEFATKSTYYTYTNVKQGKSDSTNTTRTGFKRIVAGVPTTEPSTQKRSSQSAQESSLGPDQCTPKTPQSGVIFRRKWGGASSTKSQKSVSSTKSTGLNQIISEINTAGMLHKRSARHSDANNDNLTIVNEVVNSNTQQKRKKSRPNSSSKTAPQNQVSVKQPNLNNYTMTKTSQTAKGVSNLVVVYDTPPITTNKTMRSSSNEIELRTNQIDFTQLARNRLQTYSSKKQIANLNPNNTPFNPATQDFASIARLVSPVSSSLPPSGPQTKEGSSTAKKTRRSSKSKSIPRQFSGITSGIPPSSSSRAPINIPAFQKSKQTASAQSQQAPILATTESVASKTKKLKNLLQTAASGGTTDSLKGSTAGQGTPSRNSASKQVEGQDVVRRRSSQQSSQIVTKGGQAVQNQNSVHQRKHMTPVMQSKDRFPPFQHSSQGKLSKTNDGAFETVNSVSNTCKSQQENTSQERVRESENQNTASKQIKSKEKQVKSHRVEKGSEAANLLQITAANTNRNRSSSNQKPQQSTNSATQMQSSIAIKETSQTDTKRKEGNVKRKKSATRRGKSAKRPDISRGRSPQRGIPGANERYHSPQVAGLIYSAFRMRALKPKKAERGEKYALLQGKHGSSVGQQKNENSNLIHVGLLTTDANSHQQLLSSASASNSMVSQKPLIVKQSKHRSQVQKQQMLSNIQNQVLAGAKALGTKRNKNEIGSRKGTNEKKKPAQETSHKVDLMKASLMTDIRIENRQQRQSLELNTPSQTSLKSVKRINDKEQKRVFIKTRSISSDERLENRNQHIRGRNKKERQSTDEDMKLSETNIDVVEDAKVGNSSPKFLLSLRQLEKLLFSTQKISQQLKKTVSSKAARASQVKKAIIQSSLKTFQQTSTYDGASKKQTSKTQKDKKYHNTVDRVDAKDQQYITIQPNSLNVFNTLSDRSSIKETPQMLKSQTTASLQQMMAQDSTTLRRDKEQGKLSSKLLQQLTAKRIASKINMQSSNLLSLVELQKLRAKRMASTQRLEQQPQIPNHSAKDSSQAAFSPRMTIQAKNDHEIQRQYDQPTEQEYLEYKNEAHISQSTHHAEESSAQRLQSLIYAKLESRQSRADSGGDINVTKTVAKPLEELVPAMIKTPLGPYKKASSETVQAEIDDRSTSSRKSYKQNNSFLQRVKQRELSHSQSESSSGKSATQDKDMSMCSLKQPSLRQITSSQASRSNKHLPRQESADLKRSLDPNASITLSRILLETSMQQSEHGIKDARYPNRTSNEARQNLTQQLQQNQVNRLKINALTAGNSEAMSYQSVNSPQSQTNSGDQPKSMPRSYTNPDKFSNPTSKNSKQKSPLQHFMADEIWPTSQPRRKRTSSITSLSNSTPGSRTLEQLKQTGNQTSTQQSMSPVYQPTHHQKKPSLQDNPRRGSQNLFEEIDGNYQLIISPIKQDSEQQHNGTSHEDMHVQDQALSATSIRSLNRSPSENQDRDRIETEAMMSRGTSSPERRRSPHKPENFIHGLHPIAVDNSTSFNNDGDYDIEGDTPEQQALSNQKFKQDVIRHMMDRSDRVDESYEEAPYEKSQNQGLNLILFQGTGNFRDSDGDGDGEDHEREQILLSSINSQAENGSSSTHDPNPRSTSMQEAFPPLPLQIVQQVSQRMSIQSQDTTECNPSQLAGIEEVFRMQDQEATHSLVSVDSNEINDDTGIDLAKSVKSSMHQPVQKQVNSAPASREVAPLQEEKRIESPLEKDIQNAPKSDLQTPKNVPERRSLSPNCQDSNRNYVSSNDVVSHDQIILSVDRAVTPSDLFVAGSAFASAELLFEEAVNTDLSPKGDLMTPIKQGSSVTLSISPLKPVTPISSKVFDIDSLNEIKKANDLASKKVEITNQIFEMLVNEVKDSLFPMREDEEEILDESNGLGGSRAISKKKKKKRSVSKRVRKASMLPKIKEIRDGVPVDMCLKRIQIQAKLRQSFASVEIGMSQSATCSLSVSKEDEGVSYLDQTKSKEQLEASSQFHQIELRKQEQLDLLQKSIQAAEESQTTSKKEDDDLKRLALNLRGIKTTTDVVDQYLNTLFDTLIENEQEFLDNLATPFSLNPIQELINLQVLSRQSHEAIKSRKNLSDRHASSGFNSQENELEIALFGFQQQQHPVLSVEIYLDIERRKDYVLLADSISEINMSLEESLNQTEDKDAKTTADHPNSKALKRQPLVENQSMLAEWENIHNKVLFDAVNDALDEFRPYGHRGPPAPWSGQTRALTYRYSQNGKEVLQQVRDKVVGLSKTFGGALANSELLREYHIRGPLEQDKLQMLREERLAIMMMQDVEENQHKWEYLERQETGIKIDLSEMILEQLTMEIVNDLIAIEAKKFNTQ